MKYRDLRTKVTKLYFQNYNNFENKVEIDFTGRANKNSKEILFKSEDGIAYLNKIGIFGPNASGKTSVLNAFADGLYLISKKNLDWNFIVGELSKHAIDKEGPMKIGIDFSNAAIKGNYEINLKYEFNGEINIIEKGSYKVKGKKEAIFKEVKNKINSKDINFNRFSESLLSVIASESKINEVILDNEVENSDFNTLYLLGITQLSASLLIKNGISASTIWKSNPNTASIYNYIYELHRVGYTDYEISEIIKRMVQSLDDKVEEMEVRIFSLNKEYYAKNNKEVYYTYDFSGVERTKDKYSCEIIYKNYDSEVLKNIEFLSEGTITFVDFMLMIYLMEKTGDRHSYLLCDEFDKNWHATISKAFLSLFEEGTLKNVTMLFTSHHPEIMDILRTDSSYVINRYSEIIRLSNMNIRNDKKISNLYYDVNYDIFNTIPDLDNFYDLKELLK